MTQPTRSRCGAESEYRGRVGGRTEENVMAIYEVDLVWHGGTYRECIEAMSAERARRAALARYPGASVMRVVRVGRA